MEKWKPCEDSGSEVVQLRRPLTAQYIPCNLVKAEIGRAVKPSIWPEHQAHQVHQVNLKHERYFVAAKQIPLLPRICPQFVFGMS